MQDIFAILGVCAIAGAIWIPVSSVLIFYLWGEVKRLKQIEEEKQKTLKSVVGA